MVRPSRKHSSRRSFTTRARLLAVAVAGCYAVTPAWAVSPGDLTFRNDVGASVNQTGNTTTITTTVDRAIADAKSFNVWRNEILRIQQPTAASAFLVNVLSAEPSQLLGHIWSNAQFWITNQAGVMVGPGARIDTAAFVASTLKINESDFLAGKLTFLKTPGAGGVINQGMITTPSGGKVYLVGSSVKNESVAGVENSGIISAPNGEVILAAGETVNLIDTSTPGVRVEITGAEGNVTNLGTVLAEAGRIGMAGVLVRNSGVLDASGTRSANTVVADGGRIFLKASKDTYVDGDGRIVATGAKGGKVEVLGERVAVLDNASIDVSGDTGGGTILVGGDYQGKNPDVQNARTTYFGKNARLKADATDKGNGGKVILWSDDTTRAYGNISARGGVNGGNGGFIETSGHRYLDVSGARVDTRAAKGKVGSWLLDPTDISIVHSASSVSAIGGSPFDPGGNSTLYDYDINTWLGNTDLIIQTVSGSGGSGNVTMTGATIAPGAGAYGLTIAAYGGTGATGNIGIYGSTISMSGDLKLIAGWDGIGYTSADIVANKGNIDIYGSTINAGIIGMHAGSSIALGNTGVIGRTVINSSGAMQIDAKNLTLTGYGGSAVSGTYGGGVLVSSGGAQTVTVSDTITLQAGSANNASYYGAEVYGASVSLLSGGNQTISARVLAMYGGASGHDNTALIRANGVQNITAGTSGSVAGIIAMYGGGSTGSYNNSARILQQSSSGNQNIAVEYGGTLAIYGGSGDGLLGYYPSGCSPTCDGQSSHNVAMIENKGNGNSNHSQVLTFSTGNSSAAGTLYIKGGSTGRENSAGLENDDNTNALITDIGSNGAAPNVIVIGGASGGAIYGGKMLGNDAGISAGNETAGGTLNVVAKNFTLTGGGGDLTPAYVGAQTTNITTYGDIAVTGGSSSADTHPTYHFGAPAAIGNEYAGTVTLTAYGNVTLTGGSGTRSPVLVGSLKEGADVTIQTYNGGDVTLAGNKSGVYIGSFATTAATDTSVNIKASGNFKATASSDTSGNGDIWIGSQNGALVNFMRIFAGKNLEFSSPGKSVHFGQSSGTSSAAMKLRAGWDWDAGTASSTGGNLTIGSSSSIHNTNGLEIQVNGGSAYGGHTTINGSITGDGAVDAYSTGNITVGGTVNSSNNDVKIVSGYNNYLSAASSQGGNLDNSGTIASSGANNLTLQAYGGSSYGGNITSTGSITKNTANGAVLIRAAGNVDVKSVNATQSGRAIDINSGTTDGSTFVSGKTTTLGTVTAAGGTITVKAGGAILDDNDTSTKLTTSTVSLTSYHGGTSGNLAISADTAATDITATVNAGSTYGGIAIRNTGSSPTTLNLTDNATNGASVSFYNSLSLSLASAYRFTTTNGGNIKVSSGGYIDSYANWQTFSPGTNGKVTLDASALWIRRRSVEWQSFA
jgi:filamentous hemagglutinin family protein